MKRGAWGKSASREENATRVIPDATTPEARREQALATVKLAAPMMLSLDDEGKRELFEAIKYLNPNDPALVLAFEGDDILLNNLRAFVEHYERKIPMPPASQGRGGGESGFL